jgi:hypothetical protein
MEEAILFLRMVKVTMDRTAAYFDLLEAFELPWCPLCLLVQRAVDRSISAINHESAGDPQIREQLRVSLGFCHVHAYTWLKHAHVLGTAAIYAEVLTRTLNSLQSLSPPSSSLRDSVAEALGLPLNPRRRVDDLEPDGPCVICQVERETEQELMRTLVAMVSQTKARSAYERSPGLCLPHLRAALQQSPDEAFTILRDRAIAQQELLIGQLREIVRRHDYRYMHEPAGPERGAAERAVWHVVGAPVLARNTLLTGVPDS